MAGPERGAVRRAVLEDPELGRVPDRVVAHRHDTSISYVAQIRTEAGIPPGRGGVPKPVRDRRSDAVKVPLRKLGTMPDAELARRYRLHRQSITSRRRAAGIPRYQPPAPEPRPPRAPRPPPAWTSDPDIGQVPDAQIARRHALAPMSIVYWRRKLGLPKPPLKGHGKRADTRGEG